jgi:general secretion pathway protein K
VVLREDGRAGSIDHLAEPWAVPLREARLSTFLAAGSNGAVSDSESLTQQVFLSGRITDMQSRLNMTNLLDGNKLNERSLLAFARLYRALGLPDAELRQWTTALLAASQTPPAANAALLPQRFEQLRWLGLSAQKHGSLGPAYDGAANAHNREPQHRKRRGAVCQRAEFGAATSQQWLQ